MQRIIRALDAVAPKGLTPAHIRTATLVRLPFHLCTGSLLQITDPDNSRMQIWLRNRLSIPHDVEIHMAWDTLRKRQTASSCPSTYLTDAIIVNADPKLSADEFDAIKAMRGGGIGSASLKNPGFRLLNETIVAHQMVRLGPYPCGVGMLWPRMLTDREIREHIVVELVLVAEPNRTIDNECVLTLLADVDRSFPFHPQGGGMGDLRDYSPQEIVAVQRAIPKIIRTFREHNAIGIKNAKTVDELGFRPGGMMDRMLKGRDYKQYALDALRRADIIRMTEDGRL